MDSVERSYPEGRLPVLCSPVLGGFAHAFSTRQGGISPAPYDSLNLAMRWGDARENVHENRRRLFAACGVAAVCLARQVHGAAVVKVEGPADIEPPGEADALVTDVPGLAVGVFTADCVPLLVADPGNGAVAAIHAGWRGVVAGVVPAAIQALVGFYGSRPGELRVALGPAIAACCFEVGDEVAATFATAFPGLSLATTGPAGKPHLDLKRALGAQLTAAGVLPAHVDAGSEWCTKCDPTRFFSYRRDNTRSGQQLSVIVAGRTPR